MDKKKIEFEFRLGLGDTVVSSCFVRDFWNFSSDRFEFKMTTNYPHIWDHNPHLSDFDNPDLYIPIGPRIATQRSQTSYLHISHAYRMCFEYILKENYDMDMSIPQDSVIPELYLSKEEQDEKPEIEGDYWLITTGGSPVKFTSKLWPFHRWQQVVDAFPSLQFVQIGADHDFHPKLQGKNVVDMIGQTDDYETGIRRLMKLFYHCVGSLGLISAQMHLAAAFQKRCVTIAGAREPVSFEIYNFQQYLSNQGCMRCPKLDKDAPTKAFGDITKACWRDSVDACPNTVIIDDHKFTKCLAMITTDQVIKALQDHYVGGFLDNDSIDRNVVEDFFGDSYIIKSKQTLDNTVIDSNVFSQELEIPIEQPKLIEPIKPLVIRGGSEILITKQMSVKTKPIFKLVCNCSGWGGGERSAAWIAQAMVKKGFEVHVIGTKSSIPHPDFEKAAQAHLYTNNVTDPCDILLLYANDSIWEFDKPEYEIFKQVQAEKMIMVLNFRLGSVGVTEWSREWDLYGFLNFTLRDSFLEKFPEGNTFVLSPPIDIEPFLRESILNLNSPLHLVRVTSQASQKFPEDSNEFIKQIKELRPLAEFSFLGHPDWLMDAPYIHKFPEYSMDVREFLKRGNLFWYPLPDGFYDQGPRVIIEALAIGLPVIADNRGGAKDRVILEVGWLCDGRDQWLDILATVKGETLEKKGHAAKKYARDKFNPDRWLEKILK